MPLVVRKIEIGKWNQRKILEGEPPSADAITGSMRTTRNSLSVWSIPNSLDLEEAVLAIASTLQKTDTLDFLIVDSGFIKENGLVIDDKSPGLTHYVDFMQNHRDIVNLDYHSLGTMANVFVESIKRCQCFRFTSSELKKILLNGIDEGKINKDRLDPSLLAKLFPQPKN